MNHPSNLASPISPISPIRGRVLEVWSSSGQTCIELAIGSDRFIFKGDPSLFAIPVIRGDLIQLEAQDDFRILSYQTLGGAQNPSGPLMSDALRWRRSIAGPSRMTRLHQRQNILRAIRENLYECDFLEVETPLLVKGTTPDTFIQSIVADEGYLVTSTEYQIKRLMVGGFEKVFTLTKNFRSNDRGRYHSSEFTMLEWARAYGSLSEIEWDAIGFIQSAYRTLYPTQKVLSYNGSDIYFLDEVWEKLTVREAFQIYLGFPELRDFSRDELCRGARKANIDLPPHFMSDQNLVLSFLLDRLQPHLGRKTPTFLNEWPAFMTSSAQPSASNPDVAERSELYIAGVEVADGFPFLRDAELQKLLFQREQSHRQSEGKPTVKVDELYIQSLAEGIPPGAGMALGIDRLVMVLTGASQLADIQAFSWDET